MVTDDPLRVPSNPQLCTKTLAFQTAYPLLIEAHSIVEQIEVAERRRVGALDERTRSDMFNRMVRFAVLYDYSFGVIIASSGIAAAERILRGYFDVETERTLPEFTEGSGTRFSKLKQDLAKAGLMVGAEQAVQLLTRDPSGRKLFNKQVEGMRKTQHRGYLFKSSTFFPVPLVFMAGAEFAQFQYLNLYPFSERLPRVTPGSIKAE